MPKGSGWNLDLHKYSYSFFDLDNTLYKGQTRYLILDFSTYLVANKKIDFQDFQQIKDLFDAYFNNQIDRNQFGLKVVQTYYHGLRGNQSSMIDELAKNYWNSFQNTGWFAYTDPLLDLVKKYTIPILVSGSPLEVIKHSNISFFFNRIVASNGIVQSGVYTGGMELEVATEAAKKHMMNEFITLLDFDPKYSFAFGDSSSDFPMLEAVDPQNAYLLGENNKLLTQFLHKKWNFLKQDLNVIDHVQKRINSIFS